MVPPPPRRDRFACSPITATRAVVLQRSWCCTDAPFTARSCREYRKAGAAFPSRQSPGLQPKAAAVAREFAAVTASYQRLLASIDPGTN